MENKFKRFLSLALAVLMIVGMMPMTALAADTPTTLYLIPNDNWKIDNARFAAYFFGNGETWASMTDANGDGIYEVDVPEGYTNVIFCRMNPSTAENNWDNKWNQTPDLTVPTNGTNCYSVAGWDYGAGTWSAILATPSGSKTTLYYDNTDIGWSSVYAYWWDSDNSHKVANTWPGTAMTVVEGNIYSIEVPVEADRIIFNNGSGTQTDDLTITSDNLYDGSGWTTYTPPVTYTVTVVAGDGGTVTADKSIAKADDKVTLTVTPSDGWELDTLTVTDADGEEVTVAEDNSFTMPASNVTVEATFAVGAPVVMMYLVTIDNTITNGTVTATPPSAVAGEKVTLTVTPDDGYVLDTLTVTDGSGNEVTVAEDNSFTMPEDSVTVKATFKAVTYTVTIDEDITNGTVTADVENAAENATVTLTVTPDEGYALDTLTVTDADDEEVTVTNNSFTMPASDVTVYATFIKTIYYDNSVSQWEEVYIVPVGGWPEEYHVKMTEGENDIWYATYSMSAKIVFANKQGDFSGIFQVAAGKTYDYKPMVTVKFNSTANWETVYAIYQDDTGAMTAIKPMVKGEDGLWSCTVHGASPQVCFSAELPDSEVVASETCTGWLALEADKTYVYPEAAPALPTATVSEIENEKLTFAMNFKADEVTDAQLAYYKNWYADFELTVNQEITFNANGGADGYLSGSYDAWQNGAWVDVPVGNVTLKAGESFKIMDYAATLLNNPNLKLTYNDVYTSVQSFDCGVFFEEAFLDGLTEDLVVTLELRMYNPEDATESYTIGEANTFTVEYVPDLPTATIREIENEELTFAMNFKADEVTDVQLAYYKNWYADFELTVNQDVVFGTTDTADGYLSGSYDAWQNGAWVDVPIEDVTLKAGESFKIMDYAATLLNNPDLKLTYNDVYTSVQSFNCGAYFTPEFIAGLEEDLVVTLELKMYNPEDTTESYTIGETYEFVIPVLPTAEVKEIENDDLTFAMNFKAVEPTAAQKTYYGNWYADFELTVNQDVVFGTTDTADGYLSGSYQQWQNGAWVDVPDSDVTLKANEPLKIMAYAAEMLGQSGLQVTYKDIYNTVKDFSCGAYFTPEFIAGLEEDLVVTLELKMYNPEDATESYVIGETYKFVIPVLPTATVTETEEADLTFSMKFTADEATDAQLAYYGSWYADFILTVNKDITLNANGKVDGYLAGSYDEWQNGAWVNVPFEDVTLKKGETLKIMEYAASLMGQSGLKYTYAEVYETVKSFDCGMLLSEKFMAENPDVEITLQLRMYNPEDETQSYGISDVYVFTLEDTDYVAYNTVTKTLYDDVSEATMEAKSGETVILLQDAADTDIVAVLGGATLDLNGYELTAAYVTCYGDIIDSSKANSGVLYVAASRFMIQTDNAQLPIKNGEGYQFFELIKFNEATVAGTTEGSKKYCFQPFIEPAAHELLLKGSAASDVTIVVQLTWKVGDDVRTQNFVYGDAMVNKVINSYTASTNKYGQMFTITLENVLNYEGITCNAAVVTGKGVEAVAPTGADFS